MKFAMIGDSYVRGNNIAMSATSFNIAAIDNGMTYANYGLNGNTVASFEGWTTAPMSERYENLSDVYDIIGFEGGRNDFNRNIPIGSDSDNTNTTFKGALNVLCKGMIKKYLGKKIFGMPCWALNTDENSAGATQNDYLEAFVHIVSDIWGIPVLDTRQTGVTMNSQDFLLRYTENGTSVSHLNRDGHVLFSRKISKFLLSL